MRLSLCYCITEERDKVSIPLACQSLPLGCHMDWSPDVDSVVAAHLVLAALWNWREVEGYDLCTKSATTSKL